MSHAATYRVPMPTGCDGKHQEQGRHERDRPSGQDPGQAMPDVASAVQPLDGGPRGPRSRMRSTRPTRTRAATGPSMPESEETSSTDSSSEAQSMPISIAMLTARRRPCALESCAADGTQRGARTSLSPATVWSGMPFPASVPTIRPSNAMSSQRSCTSDIEHSGHASRLGESSTLFARREYGW